jgi:hypothetical protein
MTIQYQLGGIQKELENFTASIEAVDMEKVKKETLRRVAVEMAKEVRRTILLKSTIKSPAETLSPYESGPGPNLSELAAWTVRQQKGRYIVSPQRDVRQRAIVLNYGYPGTITPNSSNAMEFEVNGVPFVRKEVEGPDAENYWRKAFNSIQQSDELERIAKEELEAEIEEKF